MPKPDSKFFSMKRDEGVLKLKKLIDQGNLDDFYKVAESFLDQWDEEFFRGENTQPKTPEEANKQIWCFYLIASAPLYQMDLASVESWPHMEDNDIRAKSKVAVSIMSLNLSPVVKSMGIPEKDMKCLNSTYLATVIKILKSAYMFDLSEKTPKIQDSILMEFKGKPDQLMNKLNNLSNIGRRNRSIKWHLDSSLEGGFIRMLVRYFPGKKGEVIKYIRMAGYGDGEINGLVDRTAGRSQETQFLYKGRPKGR